MSNYTIHDLHGSINDIYEQFDSGKITESMAIEILIACSKVFVESNEKK